MKTVILTGETVKKQILSDITDEISGLQNKYHKLPGIAFIGFPDVPLGKYNIPFHVQLAKNLGFNVLNEIQPGNITEDDLFKVVDRLNKNKKVDAIVLLQPLPKHLNPLRIINRIDPNKEVEGFHPTNMMGTLFPDISDNKYSMCLPTALSQLFSNNKIAVENGKEWVLLLDDEFYTNPLVNMVARTAFIKAVPKECSLTTVNSDDKHLVSHCKRADFLVVVTKKPESINPEWLKPGVVIIDIYSNLIKEIPGKKDPNRLIPIIRGGVNVESVNGIASFILPIPGGLMGVVLANLLFNTLMAFKYRMKNTYGVLH